MQRLGALVARKKFSSAFAALISRAKPSWSQMWWKATIAAVEELKREKGWGDADLWHEIVNHSAR